jgi:two-component system, NtrC family, response regulator HydG
MALESETRGHGDAARRRKVSQVKENQTEIIEKGRGPGPEIPAQAVTWPLLGNSPAIRRVIHLAARIAPTDSTVLVTGETGTGKELLARTIHELSPRREKAFVAVNTSAIPENLQESELFGHTRGSFTGAVSDRKGLFEEANHGTLFLDEIGDTSALLQVKLLRVLESREVRAVGASEERRVDVRVIAATNRNLGALVRDGRFREDLFFRLNVIHIHMPPLRERQEDVEILLDFFLQQYRRRHHKNLKGFTPEALNLLRRYPFPGNVRELDNIVQRAVLMTEEERITPADLASSLPQALRLPVHLQDGAAGMEGELFEGRGFMSLNEVEKELIVHTLKKLEGNQSLAAKRLGISRSTLWRKMKEHRISS